MLCILFLVGFGLRLLNGSYLFPKYNKHFVSPLAELLGSFERNHCITRMWQNPLFGEFLANIAISEVHNASLEDIWTHGWLGYDGIHHSWTLVWFARCFVAFISLYRYHVHRVRVSGCGFLPSRRLPIRSFPRAYFNILTAGANDPAVIRFAPAVITFCLRDIKNVIRYFACQLQKWTIRKIFVEW